MFEPISFVLGMVSLPVFYLAVALIILTVEIAYESSILASITLIAAAVGYWWLGWFDPHWFQAHWTTALLYAAVYAPLGVVWTTTKWWFYVRSRARDAQAYVNQIKRMPDSEYDWPPQVNKHKADVMRWMCWWPFSFIATMLNDPIRRAFEAIYREIAVFLQAISDRAFARITIPEVPKNVQDAVRVG